MTVWNTSRISSIADAYQAFVDPPPETRPTPLFWWSGADLSRPRLEWELDQLQEQGIGGTIVGYSHLPDGSLDHGNPAPFSEEWWELFRWFTTASAERGMTTGIQDYGVIGTVLKSVASQTSGLQAGTLSNVVIQLAPGEPVIIEAGAGQVLSVIAWPASLTARESIALDPASFSSAVPAWNSRTEQWHLSAVVRTPGKIGLDYTDFDPMHPRAGSAVIDAFYARFSDELGELFGTSFRTFFQDELDLGIVMPMWNDTVAETVAAVFPGSDVVHALWHDLGEWTTAFRATYRDTVVSLLVTNYFRPIFEWLDARGVLLVMDQISRGDLRLGHRHYADFMETMQYYHGPGNDDPDLHAPRGTAAFAISASIARAADRRLVVNEAFHSSGWAVTPSEIITGANVGYVSGANHLVMHGLNYTTEAGWWEWASPDFHFRQPWWSHSAPMWTYFARMSSIVRCGLDAQDVAVLDPTADIYLAPSTRAPEVARDLLTSLRNAGLPALVVSQRTLEQSNVSGHPLLVGGMPLRAIVLPSVHTLRNATLRALNDFAAGGGLVISFENRPQRTETRSLGASDTAAWVSAGTTPELLDVVRRTAAVECSAAGLMIAQRHLTDADIHLLVNSTAEPIETPFAVADASRSVETWDAWSGQVTALQTVDGAIPLRIEPGRAAIVVVRDGTGDSVHQSAQPVMVAHPIVGPWTIEFLSGLPNTYRDFALDDRPDLGMETVHVTIDSVAPVARVDVGTRFFVLGPVHPEDSAAVEEHLLSGEPDFETPVMNVPWRPYAFSPASGIDDDPLLRDRMTGPHGLKGVRDDFLDPAVLDAELAPGALYYFCSRVRTPKDTEQVHAGSRAPMTVWVGGHLAIESEVEQSAEWYPPWSLRDLRITETSSRVRTPEEISTVVVKLATATDQPTRGYIAVGGHGDEAGNLATLRWWAGDEPARAFQPFAGKPRAVSASIVIPPGARSAVITSIGPVAAASVDGVALQVASRELEQWRGERRTESTIVIPPALDSSTLHVTITSDVDLGVTGGVFLRPIQWFTEPDQAALAPWAEYGLSDFSGCLRYTNSFSVAAGATPRVIRIAGLVGSAEVRVNGISVGILYDSMTAVDISRAAVSGTNVVEIDCANTLGNYYSRWPTPFASRQDSGGGFLEAVILVESA